VNVDLILWRHAEAQDPEVGQDDLTRELTSRGEKQAKRMAAWLDRQLPEVTRILVSPAKRTEQTAQALARKYKIRSELVPGCTVEQLLAAAQWPDAKHTVLVIGHQPVLGQTIAQLMGLNAHECAVKRDAQSETVVVTVQSPEVL
jgi:phosphohistidine phosphatase